MNARNGLLIVTVILGMSLLATGCSQGQSSQSGNVDDPWGVVTVASGQPIRIGLALSATDSQSANAELARGAQLAIGQHKSVAGFALETAAVKTECSAEGGKAAASQIVDDETLVAVIGPDCSPACQSSAPLLDEAHYTAISPACSASRLSDSVLHLAAFLRTIYPDSLEGNVAAQFAYWELGARRIAIIDDGTLDTQDAADAFESRISGLGGKVLTRVSLVPGQTDIQQILSQIERDKVDLVYAPLTAEDAATLVTQRQDNKELASVALLGGRHYWDDIFVVAAGQSADGIYAAGPFIATALLGQADASYQSLYNRTPPGPSYAYAYDAVGILVKALEKVTVKDNQGRLLIGRKALQEAIYSTANYPGLTGSLTCTRWGDCGAQSVAVGKLQDGKWAAIYIP